MTRLSPYTCSMYREEMQLLALKRRLAEEAARSTGEAFSTEERRRLEAEITALERQMGLD